MQVNVLTIASELEPESCRLAHPSRQHPTDLPKGDGQDKMPVLKKQQQKFSLCMCSFHQTVSEGVHNSVVSSFK